MAGATPDWTGTSPMDESVDSDQVPWPRFFVMLIVPPGVVHAYKNIGTENGIVFNIPNRLYAGVGKKFPVDEIRHEDVADSPFRLD